MANWVVCPRGDGCTEQECGHYYPHVVGESCPHTCMGYDKGGHCGSFTGVIVVEAGKMMSFEAHGGVCHRKRSRDELKAVISGVGNYIESAVLHGTNPAKVVEAIDAIIREVRVDLSKED